ncbi:MAG: hypothetical protein ACYDAK_05370 [Candidatus Limnocylindrales bacterium]
MAGTIKRTFGPLALTATLTTNVYNQSSALIYDVITHIHVANKTAGAVTFSLWLGATGANAAGTELFNGQSVPANGVFDWYGRLKLLSTEFLVGGASAATSLSIEAEGDQYVA